MSRRGATSGPFTIGGERIKSWPSLGAALAVAQDRALRTGAQIGVYRDGGQIARIVQTTTGVAVERVQRG